MTSASFYIEFKAFSTLVVSVPFLFVVEFRCLPEYPFVLFIWVENSEIYTTACQSRQASLAADVFLKFRVDIADDQLLGLFKHGFCLLHRRFCFSLECCPLRS